MRENGYPHSVDQAIINEYVGKQGIGAHVDLDPEFREAVGSISLNGWCTIVFHPCAHVQGKQPVKMFLAPHSLLILKGEARHDWAHSIPKTEWDPDNQGGWWRRTRRVSITMRGVTGRPAPPPRDPRTEQQHPPKTGTPPSTTTSNPSYAEVLRNNPNPNPKPQTQAQAPRERQGTGDARKDPRDQPGKGDTRKGEDKGGKGTRSPTTHFQERGRGKGSEPKGPPTGRGKEQGTGKPTWPSTNPWGPLQGKGKSKGNGNPTRRRNKESDMCPRRPLVGSTVKQGKTDGGSAHSDSSDKASSQSDERRHPYGPQKTTSHRAQRGGIHMCHSGLGKTAQVKKLCWVHCSLSILLMMLALAGAVAITGPSL